MARRDLLFRSGLTRIVVGTLALVLLYAFYPHFRERSWVLVLYLAFAVGEQILIARTSAVEDGDSVASLTRRADENAYAAKKNGGNRFVA